MEYIVGVDEVGRGCLAGPVTVTALAVPVNFEFKILNNGLPLRDSKKLSEKQREEWLEYMKEREEIIFVRRSISPKVIDKINISAAANLAAHRAIRSLSTNCQQQTKNLSIFLDGGLYIKSKEHQKKFYRNAETVVKADEKINAVALASIVAKVSRDRYMKRLHHRYPQYGLHIHKGYGTTAHREAIQKHGISAIHRKSFAHNSKI